jgi:hypothetical protein
MALALTNALFRVTPPNGCLLFGTLSDDFSKVENAFLFLTFGLYAYLPTLPDPYAANLGILRRQIRGRKGVPGAAGAGFLAGAGITAWLVCRVRWQPDAENEEADDVEVSFHFAPLTNQFGGISLADGDGEETEAAGPETADPQPADTGQPVGLDEVGTVPVPNLNREISSAIAVHNRKGAADEGETEYYTTRGRIEAAVSDGKYEPLPDYEAIWDDHTSVYRRYLFALLDVSTKADLFGVSFDFRGLRTHGFTTHVPVATTGSPFPIQVEGLDVVSQGYNVKAFTVPQISWEPLLNLTKPRLTGDPPRGRNYYPNDGGPMQILNNSEDTVALAPLPVAHHLIGGFETDPDTFAAWAFLTLPFGLKALAALQEEYSKADPVTGDPITRRGSELRLNAEEFDDVKGGLQLQLNAGDSPQPADSDMFMGCTVQLNNVLGLFGNATGTSTLGRSVTRIFNNEFLLDSAPSPPKLIRGRGVPLTRIDLSGYGASTFSNWLNPEAAFAETSQARFDVFVGRCAHEIIQVRSMVYPWGIKVVRTITMFRVGSAYVYRVDSGWKAESHGEFDFRTEPSENPVFKVHPGIISGLYNVQNIIETEEIALATGEMAAPKIVDDNGDLVNNPSGVTDFELQPVFFDADVEIENTVSGFVS